MTTSQLRKALGEMARRLARACVWMAVLVLGTAHAGSVSFSGSPLTQNGTTSSSCTYSSITETAAGMWSVVCGSGAGTITVSPQLCGSTVCNSYGSISATPGGMWTVSNCVPASSGAGVQITDPVNPPSPRVINAGAPYVLKAAVTCTTAPITQVEFFATVGTTTTSLGSVAAAPYNVTWTPTDGTYTLVAKAKDSTSLISSSSPVIVRANASPTVTAAVSPTGTRAAPAAFTLTASATDSDGIASIQWLGTGVTPNPTGGSYSWGNVLAGTYSIVARATDNLGRSADSTPITVTVSATNINPTVSVTAPVNGSSPTRPVTLTASAADSDGTVTRVDYINDTTSQAIGSATTGPTYTAQWTPRPAPGTYTIHALATDNSNGQAASAPVTFTVVNQLPNVQMTAPAASSSPSTPVTLQATASDADGTIASVTFIDDATGQIGSPVTAAPYTVQWTNPSLGAHTVRARAIDNDGGQTDSAPVTFNVTQAFRFVLAAAPQAPNYNYVAPATIRFTVSPLGGSPGFSAITLYKDGIAQGSFTAPPTQPGDWIATITLPTGGNYKFTAVGTAPDGSTGTSNETMVVVDATAPPAAPYACPAEATGTSPGATAGAASVTEMGAANYSIPLQVPPGTAGVAPSLSLAYSSQGGNGLLGMGWSLQGLSTIQRCPRTVFMDGRKQAVNYTSDDALCLDGQRLVAVSGSDRNQPMEYRTEHESYSRITSFNPLNPVTEWAGPAYFKVWTKSGQILWYGLKVSEAGSPQAAPQDAVVRTYPIGSPGLETARVWALYRIEDRMGNYVLINYSTDNANGTIRPSSILYTVHNGTTTANHVDFTYQSRGADASPYYAAGRQLTYETQRLQSIVTYADNVAVKSYALGYGASGATGRSLFQSVRECSGDGQLCLNPTSFSWTDATSGARTFNYGGYWNGIPNAGSRDSTQAVDLNGDGKSDFVSRGDLVSTWEVCTAATGANFDCGQWVSSPRAQNNGRDDIWHFADFDGDGKADLVFLSPDLSGATVQLSTGNGFGPTHPAIVPWKGISDPTNAPYPHAVGDFDGDGRAELALYDGDGYWYFCSLGGTQFTCSPRIPVPVSSGGSPNSAFDFLIADFNGDGKADIGYHINNSDQWNICQSTSNAIGSYSFVCSGYTNPATGLPSDTTTAVLENAYQVHVADYNGDGLADLGSPAYANGAYPGRWNICLSRGDRTFDCSYWNGPTANHDNSLLGDFNGDGRTDVAWFKSDAPAGWMVCESTGTGFNCNGNNTYAGGAQIAPQDGLKVVRAGDFNGDGKTDIATLVSDASGMWSVGLSGNSVPSDTLRQVTNGLGAASVFSYSPLTDSSVYARDTTAVYPEIDIQSPMYVVSRLDTSTMSNVSGEPSLFGIDYRYRGLKGHTQGAGLSGFKGRTMVDALAHMCSETVTETVWDQRRIGVVKSVTKHYNGTAGVGTCSGGTILSQLTNTWESRNSASWTGATDGWSQPSPAYPIWEVLLTASTETRADLNGTSMPSSSMSTSSSSIDVFGNPKSVSTSSSDGYSKSTTSSYYNDASSNWIIGRVLQSTVTNGVPYAAVNNNPTRVSSFSYYLDTGLLKQEVIEPGRSGTSQSITTTYVYDAFGNRETTTVTGVGGSGVRQATTKYCAAGTSGDFCTVDGRFPTYLVNTLGHVETRTYDTRFGAVRSVTGPNGLTTTSSYDKLGRKFCEQRPEQRPEGSTTGWTWSADGDGHAYIAAASDSTGAYSEQHFDGLNREVVVKTRAFDGSLAPVSATYDGRGRKTTITKPYGGAFGTTAYSFDDLNRVFAESGPGGYSANYNFNGLTSSQTVTGSSGPETTTKTSNGRGEVVDVADAGGSHLLLQYDHFGDLEKSTSVRADGGSPATTYIYYNARGQKTGMNDPDQGAWSYAYNSWGELTSQTDAMGLQTTIDYDDLGRMKHRSESGLITDWTYDSLNGSPCGTHSVGKLCQTAGNDATLQYRYDAMARVASVKEIHTDGRVFERFTTYDGMSRVREIVYPITGLTLLHTYNPYGYLQQIDEPAFGRTHWRAVSRYPDGQINVQQVRGATTTKTYDALGRPASIVTPNVQNASYAFDALGNLTSRSDTASGLGETFTYDTLNRLKTVSSHGTLTRSYAYDSLGNITSRSDLGTINYVAGTHRISDVNGVTYNYNANGSFANVSDFSRLTAYTSFGMVQETRLYAPDLSWKGYGYRYDGDHHRILEWRLQGSGGGGTSNSDTYYFSDGTTPFFEEDHDYPDTGGPFVISWKQYINTPEGVVEVIGVKNDAANTRTDRVLIRDHLGSTAVVAGDVPSEMLGYDAWGKRRNADGTDNASATSINTDRGFTGHEMMDVVGLINMNGRVYDPTLGRFLQPDPIVQAPNNLQSYNRYAYVVNNPLSLSDPTGYSWWTRNGRTAFRAIAAIVASYFVPELMQTWANMGAYEFVSVEQAATINAVNTFAPIAGGFAAGGIQGGNLQSAVAGAFTAGLNEPFGSTWSPSRVGANALAGGVSAKLQGGSFEQGVKVSTVLGLLTYGNYEMRQAMIEDSEKFPGIWDQNRKMFVSNASGVSSGLLDFFKLGGGRLDLQRLCAERPGCTPGANGEPWIFNGDADQMASALAKQSSLLGGVQGMAGSFFRFPYLPGGLRDRIVESFAGPHDMFNSGYFYDSVGNIKPDLSPFLGTIINYGNVIPAAPFAAAVNIPPALYGTLFRR